MRRAREAPRGDTEWRVHSSGERGERNHARKPHFLLWVGTRGWVSEPAAGWGHGWEVAESPQDGCRRMAKKTIMVPGDSGPSDVEATLLYPPSNIQDFLLEKSYKYTLPIL